MEGGVRQQSGGPSSFVLASAYLRHKRHQLEMSARRRFGRTSSSYDEEAQELSSNSNNHANALLAHGTDDFQDEGDATFGGGRRKGPRCSLWTLVILILAGSTLAFNILVMIGVGAFYSSIIGSIVSIMVGVSQLRLEDIESKSWRRTIILPDYGSDSLVISIVFVSLKSRTYIVQL